jgi:type IV pilus assembly protein PilW
MNKYCKGFGLVELMVSLVLGLIVTLGATQIFLAAKNTYLSQNASAAMQEDARYALSRMVQEIRMTGMYGCINQSANTTFIDQSTALGFTQDSVNPISYLLTTVNGAAAGVVTLLTADVGTAGSAPTYTLLSDCINKTYVQSGAATMTGYQAYPVRKVSYTFTGGQLTTTVNNVTSVLINNVSALTIAFGLAGTADNSVSSYSLNPTLASWSNIRTVRITLTLTDPNNRVRNQTYNVVASLRNRLR